MTTASMIELAKSRPVNFELANAAKSQLKFQIFSNKSPEGTYVTEKEIEQFDINTNLSTKILIHGWNSNLNGNWYDAFKNEYLKKDDHNVIYVDWFEPGSKEYPISCANVKPVGHFIGDFIIASKINLSNIHLIGKSLGAHVASHTGKHVQNVTGGKKIARITGLDPAGPKFENKAVLKEDRLNETDAEVVDVIHTDVGYYGFESPAGSIDFYPNGGGLQPGCKSDDDGHNESHGRSNWYFLESINTNEIKAFKANSWTDFENGKFHKEDYVIFGENISTGAKGIYYFKTNTTKPYSINKL